MSDLLLELLGVPHSHLGKLANYIFRKRKVICCAAKVNNKKTL